MSDTASQVYNAWVAIMGGGTPIRVIWHVDRAWKQEPWAKVKDSEMAADIFKMLRIELLCKLEECLASISTEFSNYFEREWLFVSSSSQKHSTQLCSYSTKKKRKYDSNVLHSKPTREEGELIFK